MLQHKPCQVSLEGVARRTFEISEWGFDTDSSAGENLYAETSWGNDLQSYIDGSGASWTAWVTDSGWTPKMFSPTSDSTLTSFGALVKAWLSDEALNDWVQ